MVIKMINVEIAKKVEKELNKKGYDISFNKILDDLDVSHDDDLKEKDIENIVESYVAELEYL